MLCRSGGVFTACCHVLLAMVRHRTAAVRRCMALLAASARALLRELLRWQAPKHAEVARQCAEHLSHLYEDIAERKVQCFSKHDSPPAMWYHASAGM